jgi:hypothetical protein
LIKGIFHEEDLTIVNIYALNVGTPNFTKEILLNMEAHTDPNTVKSK